MGLQESRNKRGLEAPYYPLFLNPRGRRALVVGAGKVGTRKLGGLLEHEGFTVDVVEPAPSEELRSLMSLNPQRIHLFEGRFEEFCADRNAGDWAIVFAATNDSETNAAVGSWAKDSGVLVNRVDAPEESDFMNGASIRMKGITVVISSNGANPGEVAALKKKLLSFLDQEEAQE
ncbi:MAG: bifunctional precorrin-2 dehydrogenase/sirohydrochlorin ferrochelatase [Candidatus Sumerlaeia bacterium]|nr:bifunctional precorrin-2 dehydrogenase/sirohydrochlorin ferrochelatase [Candidatus Sumerlaeia bacterium]